MSRRHHSMQRKFVPLAAVGALLAGLFVAAAAPAMAGPLPGEFTSVFSANTTGDVIIRGNTSMTCKQPTTTPVVSCVDARNNSAVANNEYPMVPVDVDSDNTTSNSSSATITIPAGASVLYAALTWGGVGATLSNKNQALLKIPGANTYSTITSTKSDLITAQYQEFADVTAAVTEGGSGSYTVANVKQSTGTDKYAGWSIVVAYRDITQPVRNLAVYSGFKAVVKGGGGLTVSLDGFKTPLTGDVLTEVGMMAWDGDGGRVGDGLKVASTDLSNTPNPVTDVFNSTITDLGVDITDKNPNYRNQFGLDVDRFAAPNALAHGATSTSVRFTTINETYYPGLLTFATELYSPKLTAVKTGWDDLGGSLNPGDVLNYSVVVTNTGTDTATGAVVTDTIPENTTYVPGSLTIDLESKTDAIDSDTGSVSVAEPSVTAYIGTGATSSTGGTLLVNASATVFFQVKVNDGAGEGTEIRNTAALAYAGVNIAEPLTGSSNTTDQTVLLPPTLTFESPSTGYLGVPYSNQLTYTGGTSPFVWTSGTLPPGVSLDPDTGLLSGTPSETGKFDDISITITDTNNQSNTKFLKIYIELPPATVTLTPSAASVQFGDPVTLTANVDPSSATGTVTFTNTPPGGVPASLGTGVITSGVATLTTALPAFGLNSIVADYPGDDNNGASASAPVTVENAAYSGEVVISEFRSSGPAGNNDQYIELYNTGAPAPIGGFVITPFSGTASTVPDDAPVLPTGRSYLIVGEDFTLNTVATPDYYSAANNLGGDGFQLTAPDTANTTTDAVGPSTGYFTGDALPDMSYSTAEWAWVRHEIAGQPVNSEDNLTDFVLVSTTGESVGGVPSAYGSPSPTGWSNAFQRNDILTSTLLDTGAPASAPANREYIPGNAGGPGTLTIRRTITNTTDDYYYATVRISSLSEANGAPYPGVSPPATIANLRLVDPATDSNSVTTTGGTVTVDNLHPGAPNVGLDGGLNSTLMIGIIGPHASKNVSITFENDTTGRFWFGYDVDALIDLS